MSPRYLLLTLPLSLAMAAWSPPARAQDAGAGGSEDARGPDDPPPPDAGSDAGAPTTVPCPDTAAGCADDSISYQRRQGLPVEFDFDTGWVPAGSPVQVRFHTALAGHTEARAAGTLQGSWAEPITLRAHGRPGSGFLRSDYGVVLDARIRLHLVTDLRTFDWEGRVPYIPHVDFRATSSTTFDPWAWGGVSTSGSTMRQHLADIPLTDAFIPIPGISGGLSFDARADMTTRYRSTRISFAGDADPITAMNDRTLAIFTAGPQATYFPRLEGRMEYDIDFTVYPALYVSLLGRRWMFDIIEVPIGLPGFGQDWLFDPSEATFQLPDIVRRENIVDFGRIPVGSWAHDSVSFESVGRVPLRVTSPIPSAADPPFVFPTRGTIIAPRTTGTLPVEFNPEFAGTFEHRVPFNTNDPDSPTAWVTLRGVGYELPDAGTGDANGRADASPSNDAGNGDGAAGDGSLTGLQNGGCGCDTAGSSRAPQRTAWISIALFGLAVASRRRRVRAS